ncbi:MAG: elongation factor P [Rickettsiaceae bacterium]
MKISANSIKSGNILIYNDNLWIVTKNPEHTKPGKGNAYIKLELKNFKTKVKTSVRFVSTDTVQRARLEQKEMLYLYCEGSNLILMDNETFEQIFIDKEILGDKFPLLEEDMIVTVEFHDNIPLTISLPLKMIVEIAETDPVIKGSTVTSSYKPAIMTNGMKIMLPSYLTIGEKVVINTDDLSFVERSKKT